MDYRFMGDFSKAALGAFTEAEKKKVWNDPSMGGWYDADKSGKYFSIVEDARFPGGRACRMTYLKGKYGMGDQFYQVRMKSPQSICNLEYYWLWEDGFSFYTDVPGGDGGGGKLGPCINWGEVGGEESKRGTRPMFWWNSHGSHKTNFVFNPVIQDQRTGNQLVQPPVYSKTIELNKIYRFRIQMKGGPGGFCKHWVVYPGETAETLLSDVGPKDMQVSATDDVLYDFAFFSGGASTAYSPAHDSYARHGGVRYWSGEEYWASDTAPPDTGNGDGGTGEGGDTGPTPPAGEASPFSIAVGETKIFRSHWLDALDIGVIKWSLTPNNVSWGPEAGPSWSAIEVKGKTAGNGCVLVATDSSSGISTAPVKVDVTETPRSGGSNAGVCTVDPLPQTGVGAARTEDKGKFSDKPPQ